MKKAGAYILTGLGVVMLLFLVCLQGLRDKNLPPIMVTPAETFPPKPGKLNINTATAEQLQTLPGIGPSLAQKILDYRRENGDFQTVSELTKIDGIGIGLLDGILDAVTVGG